MKIKIIWTVTLTQALLQGSRMLSAKYEYVYKYMKRLWASLMNLMLCAII